MYRFLVLSLPVPGLALACLAALLTACAVERPLETAPVAALDDGTAAAAAQPGASSATAAPTVAVAEVESAEIEDFDTGLVCESRQRPGSRMHEKVCYTREEYAASAEARREEIEEFVRQVDEAQRNMEMMRQQQQEERRRSMVRSSGL